MKKRKLSHEHKKALRKGWRQWWNGLTSEEQMREMSSVIKGRKVWWNLMTLNERISAMGFIWKGREQWWSNLSEEGKTNHLNRWWEGRDKYLQTDEAKEYIRKMIEAAAEFHRGRKLPPEHLQALREGNARYWREQEEKWKEELRGLYGFPKDAAFIPMSRRDYWFCVNVLSGDKFYSYYEYTGLVEDQWEKFLHETRGAGE